MIMNEEKLNSILDSGASCSQVILLYFAEHFKTSEDELKEIGIAFEAGNFQAKTCGCVTGSYIVLGKLFSNDKLLLKQKLIQFTEKFTKKNSSVICSELLDSDISQPENLAKAFESGKIEKVCPQAIKSSIEIIEELLN